MKGCESNFLLFLFCVLYIQCIDNKITKCYNETNELRGGAKVPQTTVNFRIEESLKADLEALCEDLGITMTTAFTIFAKKATRENRIPFDLTGDPLKGVKRMSQSYEEAGVNLEAGYESVERIKKHVVRTNRPGVFSGVGGFGGMFDLSELNLKEPMLVSGTDGVGTKLLVAIEANKHDTIGIDAVAMCVNDIVVQGAEPLYFLIM